jgi:hypothetical protein
MFLSILQRNIQRRWIRYALITLGILGMTALLDREKGFKGQLRRLSKTDTDNGIKNTGDLGGDDLNEDFWHVNFGVPQPETTQPLLHLYDQKGSAGRHKHSHRLGSHYFRDDGLVEVNPRGRHPIYDLMSVAEQRWKEKLARQSTTLGEAVMEYKKRYQRDPPMGFKDW